ncbi:hypothetical protein [Salmonirosea aquatica]|uniref:Uncharacterized protein n=1 Tax=Salmonirosea aquatica TaxID=2654236 RepID=A0A7C9FNX1_9BACT|nr:hypothetical protein [Cytophagaceae bacterium SJW1-29]
MQNDKKQPESTTLVRFGNKKIIPDLLREEILLALSYYPELLHTHIEFVILSPSIKKSIMQAQPLISTLFRTRAERGYVIKISRYFQGDSHLLPIETIPQNILIGWVGHELGHIMDYLDRSVWSMARYGLGYLFSRRYLMQAERTADLHAISHGLGEKIIATKNFILDHAHLPERYKEKIRRLYVSPEETVLLVEEYEKKL